MHAIHTSSDPSFSVYSLNGWPFYFAKHQLLDLKKKPDHIYRLLLSVHAKAGIHDFRPYEYMVIS